MQNTDGEAGKRVFVKVFGFSDVERHALNTVFRLSESRPVAYALWNAEAPQHAKLALLDGDSWEVALELANPAHDALKIIWIGERPPRNAVRVFARPVQWAAVIEGLDQLYYPESAQSANLNLDLEPPLDFDSSAAAPLLDIDFDLAALAGGNVDTGPNTEPMSLEPAPAASEESRVLVVGANLETRLYLRARLALAGLMLVDDAATAAEALQEVAVRRYVVVMVDKAVADMNCWKLVRALRQPTPAAGNVILIGRDLTSIDALRARFVGVTGVLRKPLHPGTMADIFRNLRP